ncbi:Na+/H+ antiporter NhaA [Sphingopyxis fribergensis]|uniref:Na+/H+ antiporter NhaA n=1 Tax=Sphingopyxis fribergensis TaxID=1515612 RepID=UPI00057F8B7B|nr:Na+/H+ antiporter NhaA [Sphingopyxis fribergensis]
MWLAVKTGFAIRPRGATWLQVYAVSVLCGIGCTMSLFIGGLAFANPELVEEAKLRTLAGSLLAALVGFIVQRRARRLPNSFARISNKMMRSSGTATSRWRVAKPDFRGSGRDTGCSAIGAKLRRRSNIAGE